MLERTLVLASWEFVDVGSLYLTFLQKILPSLLFLIRSRSRVTIWPKYLVAYGEMLQLHGKRLGSKRNSSILTSEITLSNLKIVDQIGLCRF